MKNTWFSSLPQEAQKELTKLLSKCLIPTSTTVTCAVSGGADSLALLVLMTLAGKEITAIHVDHGLREGSDQEYIAVQKAANLLGATFQAKTVELDPSANLEARARSARYSVLPEDVLLGHTADDQAETILLNLMRGAGVDGMAGMDYQKRPMLNLRRQDTERVCELANLSYFQDPSNTDPSILRNRVRRELLPLMRDISQKDVTPIIASQAPNFRQTAYLLDDLVSQVDPQNAKQLKNLNPEVAKRALRNWIRKIYDDEQHPPTKAEIERVMQVARGEVKACQLRNNIRITRTNQRLKLEKHDS